MSKTTRRSDKDEVRESGFLRVMIHFPVDRVSENLIVSHRRFQIVDMRILSLNSHKLLRKSLILKIGYGPQISVDEI